MGGKKKAKVGMTIFAYFLKKLSCLRNNNKRGVELVKKIINDYKR
jgi:hypothetical protein